MTNPFQHVIDWLDRTPEGEAWSKRTFHITGDSTLLVSIKRDGDKGWPESVLWWYQPEPSMLVDD